MNSSATVSLRAFNSLQLESKAERLVIVEQINQLENALDTDEPLTILGEGTNVVLKPKIAGRVVKLAFKSIDVEQVDEGLFQVRAGAGVNWHELVRFTLGQNIGGLENLALIPGSVGAAPFQNIGAYGVELAELCDSVSVYDRRESAFRTLPAEACEFAYRDSMFKSIEPNRFVICGLNLLLGNRKLVDSYKDVQRALTVCADERFTATEIAERIIQIRRRKLPDPRLIGNVGSFFKNPILTELGYDQLRSKLSIDGHEDANGVKVAAARLIDEAGWKGVRDGQVQVWPNQPLVLVNRGNATARELLDFAARIADDIHRRFDVVLELEPQILGSY